MMTDNRCDEFIEEITRREPPSPALQTHLAACPDCRAMTETMRVLRQEASAYSPALTGALTAGVLARLPLDRAVPAPAATSPATATVTGTMHVFWALAIGTVITLAIVGVLWFGSPSPQPERAVQTPTTPMDPGSIPSPAPTAVPETAPEATLPPSEVPGLDGE